MNNEVSEGRAERLLIIDDQSGVRDTLTIKFEREGYTVAVAENAQQAEAQLATGGFDLVLLDIRLPDASGFDLLARLRETYSPLDLPIIIISGLGQSDDVVRALKAGANDYLTKPFDLAVVLARVHTQLTLKYLKTVNDHFMRVATHDLKRPLTLILDVARNLKAEYPAGRAFDEQGLASLDLLIESGDYMEFVVRDLLDLHAIRDGRLQLSCLPTDLGATVRQVVARNVPYARSKDIELLMRFDKDLPPVHADNMRLMQILDNLIGNAIKFSPRCTQVTVCTCRKEGELLCEVRDHGPGIPVEDMQKLFTEYAQLHNQPTGGEKSNGLGLAISRELVHLLGGEIGADNNPEGGANFWFRLPVDQ